MELDIDEPHKDEQEAMVGQAFLVGFIFGVVMTLAFVVVYILIRNIVNGVVTLW